MKLRVYSYNKCSTCRDALKFLQERKVDHDVIAIQDSPPTLVELKTMLGHVEGIRKLFNTSGLSYKALGLKNKLNQLSEADALALLVADGMLVRRPFVLTSKSGVVGFSAEVWEKLFQGSSS